MIESSTIIALASPGGIGALSIIRISGTECHNIVEECILEKSKFRENKNNKIARYTFINPIENKFIDDITAIKYSQPYSFTGENMVEIICHGSKIIINAILTILEINGCNIAEKGEFTRRAFLNGKMDLIKAENIKNLIECKSELQFKINEKINNKKHEEVIKKWIKVIKELLVFIETNIEFSEDVKENIDEDKSYLEKISNIKKQIERELKIWKKIEKYQTGLKIVIAGPTNAGKSSLFNKILGLNRSIVTNIPGTTRDTISENIIMGNNEIRIVDTAGIRKTKSEIEKNGISRTEKEIKEAHIVIWIIGIDQLKRKPPKNIVNKTICVINKIDLDPKKDIKGKDIKISLKNNKNVELLINKISKKISETSIENVPDIISNKRHVKIAENVKDNIKNVIEEWEEKEKVAYYLYKTLEEFEDFFGRRDKEEIYNTIFDSFCIGK